MKKQGLRKKQKQLRLQQKLKQLKQRKKKNQQKKRRRKKKKPKIAIHSSIIIEFFRTLFIVNILHCMLLSKLAFITVFGLYNRVKNNPWMYHESTASSYLFYCFLLKNQRN